MRQKTAIMHLSEITHPNQLHVLLSIRQLEEIAREIREKHLQTIAASGGHLGTGLGVVELTLALYQTLDLDRDQGWEGLSLLSIYKVGLSE